ncbi:MAG TPA: uroporphyrinogen-III C-methyltransferase [Devosia sp.]|nr:uroporphyrinogen-III C-methyltransferase [Devosia sp.]
MTGHFAALDGLGFPPFEPGTVWLVGAGPGAPGLISLLGYYALGQADVIVYDALVSETLLALAPPSAERVYAGKRGGKPSEKQADISLKLVEWAQKGKRVLRLKGGDPMVFGRGAEEAGALVARGIPFRIVPGITAGIGGLAYAGIPATMRDTNQSVLFLTGHDETGNLPSALDWAAVAKAAPVIVMYMAVRHLGSIADKLMAGGRDPADRLAVVTNATLPGQMVVEATLGTVAEIEHLLVTPAIVVLGPVSAQRQDFDWWVGSLRENGLG